ncbi:uncharacterized protein LOC114711210 [Neltuma alba]|uniref:uncharacterized protein LOC114711210 n=1 Tax=Neltuma alba TaxID=207710 RepID=UPI0010A2C7F4|nr:uncharacterized protein LOC114711210 [Prosopis alba]
MEYQNLGRQQRSKGANMKQALMVMLLVVGCAWLTYQINHSRHKPDDYGRLPKPLEQYWAVSLGRKGSPSWLYEIQFPTTLGKVHIEEPKNDDNSGNTDDTASKSEADDKGQGNVENSKMAVINDFESNEKEAKTLTGGAWAHTFDDENGVPPEVNGTETMGGVAQIDIVHGENISNDSKGNGAVKSNILGVKSSENDIVEVTFGGSESIVVDAEVNSQSIIAHADA